MRIKFCKSCYKYPFRFDILNLESEKNRTSCRRRAKTVRLLRFGQYIFHRRGWWAMRKKKSKGKKAERKTAPRKKSAAKAEETKLHPAEVRKEIAAMVEAEAEELAGAVIEEGKKGQLATVKYLFEMAQIYPEAILGENAAEHEESLAETLLDKLGIPKSPILHELYEQGEDIVIAPCREVPMENGASPETEKEDELVAAE